MGKCYNTRMKHAKILKSRVKDRHKNQFGQMAKSVNFVWNFVTNLSSRSIKERGTLSNSHIQFRDHKILEVMLNDGNPV